MDKLKKGRTAVRSSVTKLLNEIKDLKDDATLMAKLATLNKLEAKLVICNDAIFDMMLEAESEKSCEEEFQHCQEIAEKIELVRVHAQGLCKDAKEPGDGDGGTHFEGFNDGDRSRQVYRLPKLQLESYELSCRNWLSFWAQFKRIYEDPTLDYAEKFQYLLMSLKPGSAKEMVQSHPRDEANFEKVIDALKSRFGQENMLVEIYTRELIGIVLSREEKTVAQLYDQVSTQLRALEGLGMTSEKCAFVLYPLVESCLPTELLKVWERQRRRSGNESVRGSTVTLDSDDNPLDELMRFLEDEVRSEERIQLAKQKGTGNAPTVSALVTQSTPAVASSRQVSRSKCIFCDKEHNSQDCIKAQELSPDQRTGAASNVRACFKCLKIGHSIKNCKVPVRCLLCGKGHYALMCRADLVKTSNEQAKSPSSKEQSKSKPTEVQANFSGSASSPTYLKTILVDVVSANKSMRVRALLDDGAQRSYISQSVVDALQLKPSRTEVITHGLFGGRSEAAKEFNVFDLQLQNVLDQKKVQLSAVAQPVICHQVERPSALYDGKLMAELAAKKIVLTDVGEDPPPVQCLLGADILGNILTGRLQVLGSGVTAVETQLGWSVLGRSSRRVQNMISLSLNVMNINESWELEAIGIKEPILPADNKTLISDALIHFENTIKKEGGRYVLQLPWKAGHPALPENLDVATARLASVTAKLKRENNFEKYDEVIQDWINEGIVEKVPDGESPVSVHYLPHRPVIKDGESSTKIRPVFDASAKKPGRPSLNDCLLVGSNLLQTIPPLLTQFRGGMYGVTADIKQAFLQLGVDEPDRDVLRFLWWNNGEIEAYRHCRVVFGVTSSPFLLNSTLAYHLSEEGKFAEESQKSVIERLKNSFYVDDSISSFDEVEQVSEFVGVATEVMLKGKFELRKWTSNAPQLMEDRESAMVLGLKWNLREDTLSCAKIKNRVPIGPITKRMLLGLINTVYDPLGFLSPAMLPARFLLQEAWRQKIDWDAPLPADQQRIYAVWVDSIHELEEITIPRRLYGGKECDGAISLHVFSDASQRGYGCCIYVRYVGSDGMVTTRLVAAKSRVAPLQAMTIPRLELLGACIGVRLTKSLQGMFRTGVHTYFWTDSTTVLAWIKKALEWGTYVGRRVTEIRQGSRVENWKFVPGVMNPADVASRGCSMQQLKQMQWWEGPEWLRSNEELWPRQDEIEPTPEALVELRAKSAILVSTVGDEAESMFSENITRYFSSYLKMIRMVAWILRCKKRVAGPLVAEEIAEAEKKVLWLAQKESDCNVKGVQTSLDANGLLRVTSRVVKIGWETDLIILPDHSIVQSLIRHLHNTCQHAGVGTVLAKLRERFWVIKGRSMVKKALSACVKCKRFLGKKCVPAPSKLPVERTAVEETPFANSGMDFFGPMYLKDGSKVWGFLVTCALYRCVRLDLVDSLSTESFVRALRRFLARNNCKSLYSDCGTNFMGLYNQMKDIDWNAIADFASSRQLTMSQAPPNAPWFGGFYERLVGVVKLSLKKTVGVASLTRDELQTLLIECEAVVNSRPLTYISNDVRDFVALTPAHFLQEVPGNGLGAQELDVIDSRSLVQRVKFMQNIREQLRNRFEAEYLSLLCQKGKGDDEIRVGEIVLVEAAGEKRQLWPLARVLELLPGKDNVSRVARVQTQKGVLVRPLQRLYRLEAEVSVSKDAVSMRDEVVNVPDDEFLQTEVTETQVTEAVDSSQLDSESKNIGSSVEPVSGSNKCTKFGRVLKVPKRLDL